MNRLTKAQIIKWTAVAMPVLQYALALCLFQLAGSGRLDISIALTHWPFGALVVCAVPLVLLVRLPMDWSQKRWWFFVSVMEFGCLLLVPPFSHGIRNRFERGMISRLNDAELAVFYQNVRERLGKAGGDIQNADIDSTEVHAWIRSMNYGRYTVSASKDGTYWSITVHWGGPTWRWGVSASSDPALEGRVETNKVWRWLR